MNVLELAIQKEAMWLYSEVEYAAARLNNYRRESDKPALQAKLELCEKAYYDFFGTMEPWHLDDHLERVDHFSRGATGRAREVISRFYKDNGIQEE